MTSEATSLAVRPTTQLELGQMPPETLPALPDPMFGGKPSPYAASKLRTVTGTRINPEAAYIYADPSWRTEPDALNCANPHLPDWIDSVGGFDPRARVHQPPAAAWPLPAILPQLGRLQDEGLRFPLKPTTFCVNYEALVYGNGAWRPAAHGLAERFPAGSDFLLTPFGDRGLLFRLWLRGREFWQHADILSQFRAIVVPDFSCFCDDPVPQSLVGERQMQVWATWGCDAGYTVIPTVAWRSEDSLRRQLELWLSLHPRVNTIHLDCYGSGVRHRLWLWRWLKVIREYCAPHPEVRWLISGMVTGWAIGVLNELFPHGNYCLLSTRNQYVAAQRRAADPNVMAERFQDTLTMLDDFRSGRRHADRLPEPDHLPSFAEMMIDRSSAASL